MTANRSIVQADLDSIIERILDAVQPLFDKLKKECEDEIESMVYVNMNQIAEHEKKCADKDVTLRRLHKSQADNDKLRNQVKELERKFEDKDIPF